MEDREIGLLLMNSGVLCDAIAKTLMKKYASQPSWRLFYVMALRALSGAMMTSAFAFASQTLLVPFTSLGIFWTMIMAKFFVAEQVCHGDAFAAAVIVLGCVITVASSHSSQNSDIAWKDLVEVFTSQRILVYSCIVGGSILCLVLVWIVSKIVLSECTANLRTIALTLLPGMVAGNSFTVKACMQMLRGSFHNEWYVKVLGYEILLLFILVGLGGELLLFLSMRHVRLLTLMPVYQGCNIVLSAISANVLFRDMSRASDANMAGFVIGTVITVAGISWTSSEIRNRVVDFLVDKCTTRPNSETSSATTNQCFTAHLDEEEMMLFWSVLTNKRARQHGYLIVNRTEASVSSSTQDEIQMNTLL